MTEIGQKKSYSYNLTNSLHLGMHAVDSGEPLSIVGRSRFCEHLFLSLAVPEGSSRSTQSTKPAEPTPLRLWWLVTSGQSNYCIVVQLGWIYDDEPIKWHTVLKVIDRNTLTTITNEELKRIAPQCHLAIEQSPHAREADVALLLGKFPGTDDGVA